MSPDFPRSSSIDDVPVFGRVLYCVSVGGTSLTMLGRSIRTETDQLVLENGGAGTTRWPSESSPWCTSSSCSVPAPEVTAPHKGLERWDVVVSTLGY